MLTPDELLAFIDELRRDGFNIGAEQHIASQDMLFALAAQGHWSGQTRRLKTLLAPILCSTPQEQNSFYQRFDDWLARNPHLIETTSRIEEQAPPSPDDLPTLARRSRPWRWILAAIVLVLLGVLASIMLTPAPLRWQTLHGRVIAPDSTPVARATISFLGQTAYSDSTGHFSLTHPQKDSLAHLLVYHENFDTTRRRVQLNRRDTSRIDVKLKPKSARLDSPSVLPPVIGEPPRSPQSYEAEERRLQEIVNRINAFAVRVENEQASGLYSRYYPALRFGALLLPMLLFAAWWGWQRYRRKLILEKRRTGGVPDFQRLVVKGAGDELFHGPAFRRTAQLLRLHREAGSHELDAPATVEATLQQAGWFKPVYQRRQILPEYLVLIDRAGFHDQQARFVDEALARLRADGVFIDRYYFDSDPRLCFSDDVFAAPLALDELAVRHPAHRLMIFTDGAGLMHPLTAKPQRWLELFEAWGDRAMLTPEAPNHWGYREMALAGLDFIVLPATAAGLAVLVETLQRNMPPEISNERSETAFPEMLLERPLLYLERHVPDATVVERLCDQLQIYLGAGGYFWLSAGAVYPQLAWDLTLYLGARLTDARGEKVLTENRLLKLARLPWLRHGLMPDWLRLRLIAGLNREQERAVRQALEELLQSALAPTRDGFVLDVAQQTGVLDPRDWKRLIQDLFRTAADDDELCDYVFITFMSGRKPRQLAVAVPNLLRRVFFRRGEAMLGLQPVTLLIFAAAAGLLIWNFLPAPRHRSRLYQLSDFSQMAAAAKQEMLKAKTEADEAGAETWAAETYRRAVEAEQKGDQEMAQGNYAEAKQAYEAAADSLRAAFAEARRGVTSEIMNDVTKLKLRVANTKREMQKARLAADKVNAETLAAALFANAARLEREGGQNEALATNVSLAAANQSYVEAANGYTKAKRQVDLMIQARIEAENAKTETERAKSQLPGRAADLQGNPQFAQAEAAANNGNRQLQAADYGAARASFQQALTLYQALASELEKRASQAQAEIARNSMQAARGKVDKDSYAEPKYLDAEKFKNDAENFYAEGNFNRATERYKEAETLYVAVARESKEKLVHESEKLEATKQAIEGLISAFEQRVEQKDYNGLKALYKSFKQHDQKFWSGFFKVAENIKVTSAIDNITPSGGRAKVDVVMNIDYYNTDRGVSVSQTVGSTSWALEQINDQWVIVSIW